MPIAVIAAIVCLPVLLTAVLKSNAALGFLALCAGFVVISFNNIDIKDLTKNLSFQLTSSTFNLILLATPYVLTLLIRRKAFSGQPRTVLQWVAALCGGGLLALVAIPLLSSSIRLDFANSPVWNDLQKVQMPIVGVGAAVSLLLIWLGNKPAHPAKKHK